MLVQNQIMIFIQNRLIYTQTIEKHTYKKNCETFCHTATLLIHNLKYFTSVTYCFTKRKNTARV